MEYDVLEPCSVMMRDRTVRVHGLGYWRRTEDGEWRLKRFVPGVAEELEPSTLVEAVEELRAVTRREADA